MLLVFWGVVCLLLFVCFVLVLGRGRFKKKKMFLILFVLLLTYIMELNEKGHDGTASK